MEGLTDVKDIDKSIKIGNGGAMRACKIGNLSCEVTQLDRRKFVVNIKKVKFVPGICSNLFREVVWGALIEERLGSGNSDHRIRRSLCQA
jgi:hypothetical protein